MLIFKINPSSIKQIFLNCFILFYSFIVFALFLIAEVNPSEIENLSQKNSTSLDEIFLANPLDEGLQNIEDTIPLFEEEDPIATSHHTTFSFKIENFLTHNIKNDDSSLNPKKIFFIHPSKNLIRAITDLKFSFLNNQATFVFRDNIYLDSQFEINKNNGLLLNDNHVINELNDFYLNFYLTEKVLFNFGKINTVAGTAFFQNPTDFLHNPSRVRNVHTSYPNQSLGAYQVKLDFLFSKLIWNLAYIPLIKSDHHEFTRSHHDKTSYFGELWSAVSFGWNDLETQFIFYWDGYPKGGINATWGIGESWIFHFEGAATTTYLPVIKKIPPLDLPLGEMGSLESVNQYELVKEYHYSGKTIIGVTYTPRSILSILFEVYGNFLTHNPNNNKWKQLISNLKDIEAIRSRLHNIDGFVNLSESYKGIIGETLIEFDPLLYQPVFINLRIFRDNIFKKYTSQIFNASSQIIYSPYDSSFQWDNHFAWEAKSVFTLGLYNTWNFGNKDGVFTSTPNSFKVGLATLFWF